MGWDLREDPPVPVIGSEARYPIPMNALMAGYHGLAWMASTDHGGPNHSKLNLERAYPELLRSRLAVPGVIQFYAMEFNSPGADHSSLIIPHGPDESQQLFVLESGFDRRDDHPSDPERDTESRMLDALRYMNEMDRKPVVIANHPSRSAPGLGNYGKTQPGELRAWHDTAPSIVAGMEGAPGRQALALASDGTPTRAAPRGDYDRYPTLGGFDQMTARVGGLWDALLGEGRHWGITANSDSHVHYTEGGADFWPGEYSKTYVYAARDYDDILAGIRTGRIFVTTGDLISELYVTATAGEASAGIGGELAVTPGADVEVTVRFRDPAVPNHRGDNPSVSRVDLIVGNVSGLAADRESDSNLTTRVVARFTSAQWRADGLYQEARYTLSNVRDPIYLRVRGTNGDELEPEPDPPGENPWDDLWFYSNPVFVTPVREAPDPDS